MSEFGFGNPPVKSRFDGGVATIVNANFAEGQYGIQLHVVGVEQGSTEEITLGRYSLGKGERAVADGGKRVIGDNFTDASSLAHFLNAWSASGAPVLRGDSVDSLIGHTFRWESKELYKIQERTYSALLPVEYIPSKDAISTAALSEALVAVLAEKGPQKFYQVVLALPEGAMRDEASANGKVVLEALVKSGAVQETNGTFSVA